MTSRANPQFRAVCTIVVRALTQNARAFE